MKRQGLHLVLAAVLLWPAGAYAQGAVAPLQSGDASVVAPNRSNNERDSFEEEAGRPFSVQNVQDMDNPGFIVARYRAVVKLSMKRQEYSGSVMVVWNELGESGMKEVDLDAPVRLTDDKGQVNREQFMNLMALGTEMVTSAGDKQELVVASTGILPSEDDTRQVWYITYSNGKSAFVVATPDGNGWKAVGLGGVVSVLLKSVPSLTSVAGT